MGTSYDMDYLPLPPVSGSSTNILISSSLQGMVGLSPINVNITCKDNIHRTITHQC